MLCPCPHPIIVKWQLHVLFVVIVGYIEGISTLQTFQNNAKLICNFEYLETNFGKIQGGAKSGR
jgi:hypothetical protein